MNSGISFPLILEREELMAAGLVKLVTTSRSPSLVREVFKAPLVFHWGGHKEKELNNLLH